MNPLSLSEIAQLAGCSLSSGDGTVVIDKVSTDSRTIKRGELFVALRGENFDGHNFVEAIAIAGAAAAMVDFDWKGSVPENLALIRAKDTLQAYQQLAANYRKSLTLRVVAITGSNGKTSTKDFAAAVLARRFRVTKTQGNFNNHVGLPQTILEATSGDEVAVWEIGMNHPGEVAVLASIAAPDVGIITNVGVAHIEFMGSRERIAEEKGALAEAVGSEGTVILNADDPFSKGIATRTRGKVILAGTTAGTIRASEINQSGSGTDFTILEDAHRCRAQLPVPGLHMVQNALLAVAAGRVFALSLEECAAGLVSAPLTKARLQVKEIRGVQFLDDSYNANPDSMFGIGLLLNIYRQGILEPPPKKPVAMTNTSLFRKMSILRSSPFTERSAKTVSSRKFWKSAESRTPVTESNQARRHSTKSCPKKDFANTTSSLRNGKSSKSATTQRFRFHS